MNYLAHVYLARHGDAAMVGAMLGDFVKANDVANYPPDIAREITLHRHIDSYTDSHPVVREAALFGNRAEREEADPLAPGVIGYKDAAGQVVATERHWFTQDEGLVIRFDRTGRVVEKKWMQFRPDLPLPRPSKVTTR